ncbi:MAG: hypothetical protein R6X22_02965, partial [Gemmatimonadota bacterium]
LNRDDQTVVLAISEDGDWYQVLVSPNIGWVSAEVVRITGNPVIPTVVVPTNTPTDTPTVTPTDTPSPMPTDTARWGKRIAGSFF